MSSAARTAARFVTRRFSSGGKVLSEEEKAAENVFIKKMEKEKLEKLAHKDSKPGEPAQPTPEGSASSEGATSSGSSTASASTDGNRNYAVLAGVTIAVCGMGWYFLSKPNKTEEVAD